MAAEDLPPAGFEARTVLVARELALGPLVKDPVDGTVGLVGKMSVFGRGCEIERSKTFHSIEADVRAIDRSLGQPLIDREPRRGVADGDAGESCTVDLHIEARGEARGVRS